MPDVLLLPGCEARDQARGQVSTRGQTSAHLQGKLDHDQRLHETREIARARGRRLGSRRCQRKRNEDESVASRTRDGDSFPWSPPYLK